MFTLDVIKELINKSIDENEELKSIENEIKASLLKTSIAASAEYIDLKFEDIKLCTKVYKELGREKFIKLYEEHIENEDKTTNTPDIGQEAKADNGKPKLTLVPDQIIYDIAEVREYGNRKYGDPNNWKTVEIERYRDAAFRHFLAYIREPDGKDEESGIEHLKHLACNIAFLCALEKNKKED